MKKSTDNFVITHLDFEGQEVKIRADIRELKNGRMYIKLTTEYNGEKFEQNLDLMDEEWKRHKNTFVEKMGHYILFGEAEEILKR